jgi:outer membrane receptor for ferrienterochelin and colicin
MQRKLLTVLVLMVLSPVLLLAAGKIRGKVVDKGTGEPLVGANVVVVGTSMGAATNIAGEFIILNVPPGTYTMRSSYVGYQTITISNIRVNNELSTDASFQLPSEGVTVQTVEIVAERPLINKSATNAVRIIDAEFFEKLPARGTNAAIVIQPGVVSFGGNIYIRGGRPDEVGYMVEGVTATDVVNGGNAVYTSAEAVEQLQVQAGGFSAEFGNANAGLVQSQLRIGNPEQWRANVLMETDNYTKQNKEALGGNSFGYSDFTASAGGPLLGKKLRVFGSMQNTFFRDPNVATREAYQLSNYITDEILTPAHPVKNAATGHAASDTIALMDVGANAIGGMDNRWAFTGTMLFDLNNLQIKASGSYSTQRTRTSTYYTEQFNTSRLPLNLYKNGFANVKLSYIFSQSTFLEVTGSYFANSYKTEDPDFEDNLFMYGDTTANKALGYKLYSEGVNYSRYTFFNGAGPALSQPGRQIAGYAKNKTSYVGGRLDFTSQVKVHELKFGGEFQRYTIRRYNPAGVIGWAQTALQAPNQAELENLLNKSSGVGSDLIGYDILGNQLDDDVVVDNAVRYFGPRHPVFAAIYGQDRIEFSDVILNLGLRWDYIDPNSVDTEDPGNLAFNAEDYILSQYYRNTPKTSQISPRIGFSFPVTDRTVFHAQYGKFIQQTRLNDSYRGAAQISGNIKSGLWNSGANGWGLLPTRTTQYELGFTQMVSDNASFDITAFYKDIRDQIQFVLVAPTGGEAPIYSSLANADFSTSKGIEMKFTLRRTNRIQAQVNYTFMDSRSTATNQGSSNGIWQLGLGPNALPKYVMPTDFDFTHKGAILLDYRFAKNDGGPILQQLGLNLMLNFNSGHAFTRLVADQRGPAPTDARFRDALEPPGSSSTPWFFQLDGRIDKTVAIGPLDVNFYIYVVNLLGTDNPTGAFFRTGDTKDDGWFSTAAGQTDAASLGPKFVEMYQKVYLGLNSGNFGPPRQFRFGLRVDL